MMENCRITGNVDIHTSTGDKQINGTNIVAHFSPSPDNQKPEIWIPCSNPDHREIWIWITPQRPAEVPPFQRPSGPAPPGGLAYFLQCGPKSQFSPLPYLSQLSSGDDAKFLKSNIFKSHNLSKSSTFCATNCGSAKQTTGSRWKRCNQFGSLSLAANRKHSARSLFYHETKFNAL